MDLTKAQRLLLKIQAFLDQGNANDLSRLEKDLIKSYVIQLYDAITSEEESIQSDRPKPAEVPVTKTQFVESPPVYIPEPPRTEPVKPVIPEIIGTKVHDVPLEIKVPKTESHPVQIPVHEQVKEKVHRHEIAGVSGDDDALAMLFDYAKTDDMPDRFSHVPVSNIESALGLNERIFTLNELFGGDKTLFERTCSQLNTLSTFGEAKEILMHGPAQHFNWADPERVKMAKQFIRIVARKYPKS